MMTLLGGLVIFLLVAWFVVGGLQWRRGGFGAGMTVLRLIPPIVWAMAVAFAAGALLFASHR